MALMIGYLKDVASTGRNIDKMLTMMNSHIILTAAGDPILIRDFNPATELMTGAGLKPKAEEDVRVAEEWIAAEEQGNNQTADVIQRLVYEHIFLDGNHDPDKASRVAKIIKTLYANIDEQDQAAVKRILDNRLYVNPQTKEQKVINRWLTVDGPQKMLDESILLLDSLGISSPKVGIDILDFGKSTQKVGEENK
jgi:hypothetical protein